MTSMKRLCTAILAIVIVFTMAIPILAAAPISVTIDEQTVTVSTSGGQIGETSDPYDLTIHKYDVPTPESFTTNGTGAWIDPEDASSPIYGLKPMPNVVFRITEVKLSEPALERSTALSDYEPVTGATPVYAYTDANGEINWTNLKQAIYQVDEILVTSDGNGIIFEANSFLVSLPVTLSGSELDTVHVYPKNQRLIDKELVEDSVNGNILPWKITVDIPSDIEDTVKLEASDTLDSRLTYDASSLSAYYRDKDGVKQSLTLDTHYTVTEPGSGNNNTLTVAISADGFTELAKAFEATGTTDPKLYIEFSTEVKLTEDELAALSDPSDPDYNPITNTAKLDFTNKDGCNYTTKTDPVPVPDLFGIKATKVDGNTPTKVLPGAKFKIYTEIEDGAVKGRPLPDPSDPTEDWEVTADENGIVSFPGLTEGTYYLVETLAPDGYNLLTAYKTVVVNAETDEESDEIENLIVTTQIENYPGFILPKTGGIGTLLFTAGGLALIGTAVVIFVISSKRKSNKRANP